MSDKSKSKKRSWTAKLILGALLAFFLFELQYVKNLFLSHDRSYFRKAQEIILTPIVEAIWDKKRILEIYLNIAEFGNGIFGAQAASRYYFNKNAANLSRAEAIRLASILINPKKYQFVKSAPLINRRVNRISHDLNLVQIPQR